MPDFQQEITKELKKLKELKKTDIALEVPKDKSLGDYAFPCFILAKTLKKNPAEIAEGLAEKLHAAVEKNKSISEVKNIGPYLNFFVSSDVLAEDTLKKILKEKDSYGKGSKEKDRVMVEYSQVNTHKAFHVGHLRGTLLGSALIRLLQFSGFKVVSANYQGDIGAHVAKSLWYLTKHYKGKYPKENKGIWLGNIYQKANKLFLEKEEHKEEVSEILQKLEAGDKELTKLWKESRKWSLDEFEEIYKQLGVYFDEYFFENNLEKPGKEIVNKLKEKGIAEESEGAIVIDLEKHGLDIFILLKSDSTALYSTKDIALAKLKFEKYKIERSLYVVGSEQKLYFKQLFKTLELMGFKQAKKCQHIPYDLVMLEGGKISSREGELILAEEFLNEVIKYAEKEVKKRHRDWKKSDIEKSAKNISLAGVKFGMIAHDNNKPIIFSIEKALDFEGETGPYIQYAHARICSILRKHGKKINEKANLDLLTVQEEKNLVSMLAEFPQIIEKCTSHYRLTTLCRHLLDLAQLFNEYYHKYNILKESEDVRDARLLLITCIMQVLANGLEILGIEAPERM